MKQKLKLNLAQGAGEVLTREELKHVLGGTGSGSGSGTLVGTDTCKYAGDGKCEGTCADREFPSGEKITRTCVFGTKKNWFGHITSFCACTPK